MLGGVESLFCGPYYFSNHLSGKERAGLEVIILEYSLRLKIKRNDWLLADTCPQAANDCAVF